MNNVIFKNQECVVKFKAYPNGRPFIVLNDINTGEQVVRCTLNFKTRIDEKYAIIKDYAENKGVYRALVDAKIIYPKTSVAEVGFVEAYICPIRVCRICSSNDSIPNLCEPCSEKVIKEHNLNKK